MSRDAFASIVQAWLRSRGLAVVALDEPPDTVYSDAEREVLLELTSVLDDAWNTTRATPTKRIDPETLRAAIAASKEPSLGSKSLGGGL